MNRCEFCDREDGEHERFCALLLLSRDIEIHAGAILDFRPFAVLDLSDDPSPRSSRDFWPEFIPSES